jgi:hypothetical protein
MRERESRISVPEYTVKNRLYKEFRKRRKEGWVNEVDELLFAGYVDYILGCGYCEDAMEVVDNYIASGDKNYLEEYRDLSDEYENLSNEELIKKLDPIVVKKAPNGRIAIML